MRTWSWMVIHVVALAMASCGGPGEVVPTDAPSTDLAVDGLAGDAEISGEDLQGDPGTADLPGAETGSDTADDQEIGPACTTRADCPDDLACLEGECAPCKFSGQCEGGACVGGACVPCAEDPECGGWLCVDGECIPCAAPDGDQDCQDAYGSPDIPYECEDSGFCVPDACDSGWDCHLSHMVCKEGICRPCGDTAECVDEVLGQYAAGTQCLEAGDGVKLCAGSNLCETFEDCPEDLPVCGDSHLCRECDEDEECLEVLGVDAAVCLGNGTCVEGDCEDPAADCEGGEICKANWCGACAEPDEDQLCRGRYGDDHLCIDGGCKIADCHGLDVMDPNECAPDKEICTADHLCVSCATFGDAADQACVDTYAQTPDEDWICAGDVCKSGACDPASTQDYCVAGQVCDPGTLACLACVDTDDDPLCIQQYGDDHLCIEGDCVVAECHGTPDCIDGKICGDDHLCHLCSTLDEPDQACLDAYGAGEGDWLCAAGACQPWECVAGLGVTEQYCAAGQICSAGHVCQACAEPGDDQACKTQWGESNLCIAGACKPAACHALAAKNPNECSATETICAEDNSACVSCDTYPLPDLICTEVYGAGAGDWLCSAPGKCKPWQCETAGDCVFGQICNNQHACVACAEPGDDAFCQVQYQQYGSYKCIAGSCQEAECHSLDVQNPNACSAAKEICMDQQCVSCETFPQPDKACLDTYGAGEGDWLCWNDKCQPWECATEAHCDAGLVCDNAHTCIECDPDLLDADCQEAYTPVTKICVLDDATQKYLCKDPCTPGGCGGGLICDPGSLECVACQDWADDALCRTQYADDRLCIAGACIVADCHGDDTVPEGLYECVDQGKTCNPATNFCSFCSLSMPCPVYEDSSGMGYQFHCDAGTCNLGTCCTGDNCLVKVGCPDGKPCTSHLCGCTTHQDCWSGLQLEGCLDPAKMNALNFCIGGLCRAPVPADIEDGHCAIPFASGDGTVYKCYDAGEHKSFAWNSDRKEGCLLCNPYASQGGHKMAWTPGTMPNPVTFQATHCYIDDPDDGIPGEAQAFCRDAGPALQTEAGRPPVPFWECKDCDPAATAAGRADMFRWLPPADEPADPGDLADRIECATPRYFGTFDNPIPEGREDYPYSGSAAGRCWNMRCHGISWMPWLPLGMAGAGMVYTPAQTGNIGFVGSLGGGFGAGLPTSVNTAGNPGCNCVADGDCPGSLACVGCRCTCADDGDCAGGYCVQGSCVEGCGEDADCPGATPICVNGQCFACDGPEVCDGESVCEAGICQ